MLINQSCEAHKSSFARIIEMRSLMTSVIRLLDEIHENIPLFASISCNMPRFRLVVSVSTQDWNSTIQHDLDRMKPMEDHMEPSFSSFLKK